MEPLRRKLRAQIGHGLGTGIELYEIECHVYLFCLSSIEESLLNYDTE